MRHVRAWTAFLLWWLLSVYAHAQDVTDPSTTTSTEPASRMELSVAPSQRSPPPKAWALSLTPYLWLPNVVADTGERSLNLNVRDLAELLDAALMVSAGAQYRDFGLGVDYVWAKLGTSVELGPAQAELDLKQHIVSMRGSYRVLATRPAPGTDEPGLQLQLETGARFWKLAGALRLTIPPLRPMGQGVDQTGRSDDSWWDWILGARLLSTVTDRVRFALSGNVGGFGIGDSSDFTWELGGAAIFRIWKVLHLDVGYRLLQTKRDASGDVSTTKVTMSGIVLGLTVWL